MFLYYYVSPLQIIDDITNFIALFITHKSIY